MATFNPNDPANRAILDQVLNDRVARQRNINKADKKLAKLDKKAHKKGGKK